MHYVKYSGFNNLKLMNRIKEKYEGSAIQLVGIYPYRNKHEDTNEYVKVLPLVKNAIIMI